MCSASSETVGERPCSWVRSAVAVVIESRSSWSRRGTRIAQPRSRKCRLISPTIVGVAYVENSTPRSVSNRSTDLISPIVPTWTRSSSGSPRLRKRRAQCSTRGRWRCTSRSRAEARLASELSSSRRSTKSSALRLRVSSMPVRPSSAPSSESSMSETRLLVGPQGGRHRQGDRERGVRGLGGGAGRQGGQDLPGEAVVVGLDGTVDGAGDPDRQLPGLLEEAAHEIGAVLGLLEHHRAGLADGDTEVLDVVDREVQAGGQAGGGGA